MFIGIIFNIGMIYAYRKLSNIYLMSSKANAISSYNDSKLLRQVKQIS